MNTICHLVHTLGLGAIIALLAPFADGAPGGLDTSFGMGGKVTTSIGSLSDGGRSVALQSDGKIVVAGYSYNTGSNYDFALVRYTSSGVLDGSFGTGGKVTTPIGSGADEGYSVALQSDGKIVVAGYSYNGSNNDFALVRYTSGGALDSSFGTGGKVTTPIGSSDDVGTSMALQPDGKIVVAGYVGTYPNADVALVRYTANGTLDSSFGTGGKVTTDIGSSDVGLSVALQSDGRIVVAGYSYKGSYPDIALVRYNADGTLDSSFGTGGKVTTPIGSSNSEDVGYSVALQSDGKIVVAGYADNGSSDDAIALVRYTASGALDTSFGTGGKVSTVIGRGGVGQSVVLQSDGRILVAGDSWNGNDSDVALVRYTASGALDSSFGTGGKVTTPIGSSNDNGKSVMLQSDGKIVVAGSFLNGSYADTVLVRYQGGPPEIEVQQPAGTSLASGGRRDFGIVGVGSTADLTFTIANTGTSNLNLTGSPKVAVSGTGASFFTVTVQPTSPVFAGGGTTFVVRFAPTSPGAKDATLTITSDDADEGTSYTIYLAGNLTTQESWRQFYFGTASNSGNAADLFDFDLDGLVNLIEWACHLDPTKASALPASFIRNGANLEFTYARSVAALNAGAAFIVEWSDTLPGSNPWNTSGVTEQIPSDDGTVQVVKATLPAGSGVERFVRLKVIAPP
jgi:uncharacterized delta-60 repeat protein